MRCSNVASAQAQDTGVSVQQQPLSQWLVRARAGTVRALHGQPGVRCVQPRVHVWTQRWHPGGSVGASWYTGVACVHAWAPDTQATSGQCAATCTCARGMRGHIRVQASCTGHLCPVRACESNVEAKRSVGPRCADGGARTSTLLLARAIPTRGYLQHRVLPTLRLAYPRLQRTGHASY